MSASQMVNSAKKLKQACLPFKMVNLPDEDSNSKSRKRKLSSSETDEIHVENPNVELLNGGTKCFIKSDDENEQNVEKVDEVVSIGVAKEFDNSGVSLSEDNIEISNQEINDLNTSNIAEYDVNNTVSISTSLDNSQNVSASSASDSGKIETPSKKSSKPLLKKTKSAKKEEERLKIKQEKERAREEKLKLNAEKQRLKLLEKEQKKNAEIEAKRLRELEKEKEKQQKEEERKIKELEKEKERKQKEEEKKSKELEKEKEKKEKEKERKAKELEKEKQKEEKLLKEEIEKKKNEKVKAAFVGFFKQKSLNLDTSKKEEVIVDQELKTYFMPFQTKQDMKVAPFFRAYLNNDRKQIVDNCINQCEKNVDLLYLNLLKTGKHKPSKSEATWPVQIEDDTDVIIIETGSTNDEDLNEVGISHKNNLRKYRWKLLQFDENKRPPYWGTWRKKSLYVKPRKPFACDKIMFDYEIDSDDEWEEEDPGESIHGTDDEEEPEDDYEVDNDVFVPHGYLSDEEGDQDNENSSEEAQKEKLKLLGEEFEAEIKKKTERIKPRLVGCIWIPNNVTNPENVSKSVADTLLKYRCVWDDEEEPIITETPIVEDSPKDISLSENKKTLLLPDSIIPDLITFVHGNTNGIKLAAKNFINELVKNGRSKDDNPISISSVQKTIKNIAMKSTNVAPWCVSKENFEKYGVEYPAVVESETPKCTKFLAKKITSFLTSQNQNTKIDSTEKACPIADQNMVESENTRFIPKNLFNVEESPKSPVKDFKEKQKINIIEGKKRITPICLSPKKLKLMTGKKLREKSFSPEIEIVSDAT